MKLRLFSLSGSITIAYLVLEGTIVVSHFYGQAWAWHTDLSDLLLRLEVPVLGFPVGWLVFPLSYSFMGHSEWSSVAALVINATVMGYLLAWLVRVLRKRNKTEA